MAIKGMYPVAAFTILALTMACGGAGDNGNKVPLTPARNLSGTWKTAEDVTVNYKTDFCNFGTLALVGSEPWSVTFVITPGTDDNHVYVQMSFTRKTWTTIDDCQGSGGGAVPEVSPMFLTGVISSSNLVLYHLDGTQLGNFNFTTDILTGTFDYTWTQAYTQEEYTATNAFILRRQ